MSCRLKVKGASKSPPSIKKTSKNQKIKFNNCIMPKFFAIILVLLINLSFDFRYELVTKNISNISNKLKSIDYKAKLTKLYKKNPQVKLVSQTTIHRIEEMQLFIKSINSLGVIDDQEYNDLTMIALNSNSSTLGGFESNIGGAESECENDSCSFVTGNDLVSVTEIKLLESINEQKHEDLLNLLEQYEMLIKQLPLMEPSHTKITSHFGPRKSPFSNKIKVHQGVDYKAPFGSNVKSTGYGVVKSVKRNSTYGNYVDIEHTSKVVTRYAHLTKTLVKEGQAVTRETVIGLLGSTGRSTGPHLHYEVLVDNKQINPEKLISLGRLVKELL